MTHIAIYTRVSMSSQSTENQRHELLRVAEARQWQIVEEYRDDGISGSKGRIDRPALDVVSRTQAIAAAGSPGDEFVEGNADSVSMASPSSGH